MSSVCSVDWNDPPGVVSSAPVAQPFAALMWHSSQIVSRAYEVERESQHAPQPSPDAAPPSPGPAILFRWTEDSIDGVLAEAPDCPKALSDSMCASLRTPHAARTTQEVLHRTHQCLLDVCAWLPPPPLGPNRPGEEADGGAHSSSSAENPNGRDGAPNSRSCSVLSAAVGRRAGGGAPIDAHRAGVAYSSEDGTSVPSGDPRRRVGGGHRHSRQGSSSSNHHGAAGSPQEAQAVLQFIIGAAFSCPCAALAKTLQFAIAWELERHGRVRGVLEGVRRYLVPIPTPDTLPEASEWLYVKNGIARTATLEEVAAQLTQEQGTCWYGVPSPSAALPMLVRSLERFPELEALRGALAWAEESDVTTPINTTPISSLPVGGRRLGSGALRGRASWTNVTSDVALANPAAVVVDEEELRRQTLWSALRCCALLLPRPVAAERRDMLYRIFIEMGEVPHYYSLLSAYPDLLRTHHIAFQYILFEEGPLPIAERLMIALMAASRQRCEYLVCRFGAMLMRFSEKDLAGDSSDCVGEAWLLRGPPPRLQMLQRLIALATHVPWLVNVDEIRAVMSAGWGVTGLMQVMSILAETLSLCSFIMGLFVPNDPWTSAALPRAMAAALSASPPGAARSHQSGLDFARYTGVDEIVTENRIKGSSGMNPWTLWTGTFNWHEQGGTVMEQYYPGAAALMNNELDAFAAVVRQMTPSDCVGLTHAEYTPAYAFRSLQLYVQNIMGFMVDDYPYNSINKVLRRQAKWFAQSCTMRPETLTAPQIQLWTPLSGGRPSEAAPDGERGQEQDLMDSLLNQRGPFTLSMHPSSGCLSSASSGGTHGGGRTTWTEPTRELTQSALKLHEERLLFVLALATMEARKEGLLAVLLYPMWVILNNM